MIILIIGESGSGRTTFRSRVFAYAEGTIKYVSELESKNVAEKDAGVLNARHQNVTWVYELSSYKDVPLAIRKNADYIIFTSKRSFVKYFGKNPDAVDFNMYVMNVCQGSFINHVKVVYDVKRDMFSLDRATLY